MVSTHDRSLLIACFNRQAADRTALAKQQLSLLSQPDSDCFVTGQQPAIGGGPLYTLIKISHTIALAAERRAAGKNTVPVFWCASEDHDLGEAGHADFINRRGERQRFAHALGGGRASLRFRPASLWWDELILHCQHVLGPGLGQAWLLEQRPHVNEMMGQWTCRLLSALFAAHGLLCIEGHHLRPLWQDRLADVIAQWPTAELATLRSSLVASGHADTFGPLTNPPLFADLAEGRTALSVTEAQHYLSSDPLAISPGAALRPVLQQVALPATGYVGGPGELAYHEFITPIYASIAAPKPTLIPRCSITILPTWLSRGLQHWQCTPDALLHESAPPISSPFDQHISNLRAELVALQAQQTHAPPALAQHIASGVKRLEYAISQLQTSLTRYQRTLEQRPAWGQMKNHVLPTGVRQERVLSLFQVIWQCGPGIVEQLIATAGATAPGEHRWLSLS